MTEDNSSYSFRRARMKILRYKAVDKLKIGSTNDNSTSAARTVTTESCTNGFELSQPLTRNTGNYTGYSRNAPRSESLSSTVSSHLTTTHGFESKSQLPSSSKKLFLENWVLKVQFTVCNENSKNRTTPHSTSQHVLLGSRGGGVRWRLSHFTPLWRWLVKSNSSQLRKTYLQGCRLR